MRILFRSRDPRYKDPVGTLEPGEDCRLRLDIPASCQSREVSCVFEQENGRPAFSVPLTLARTDGSYEIYEGSFRIPEPGLLFYYFRITTANESFSLFRQGDDTNMEAGDRWQVSCIPADFETPDWAKGAVMYQIFPDRFYKSGDPDLTEKLRPYTVHRNWNEEVSWQPTPEGLVLNNDFYGGNFRGIREKLPYLSDMGVEILYLNPVSKAFSSHRYDTCDYKTPDPMLGTEADFAELCRAAHDRGVRIVLDGVYSHTGSRSIYFDKNHEFGGGAVSDPNSPYRNWYQFHHYPDSYNFWWNFDTLPCVNKMDPGFLDYIIDGEDSVVAHWLKLGADGFRLDVADELPDEFILRLKRRIRAIRPDALLIGEVWEDASNKIAYSRRRRYFVDGELDSVMNYPFRTAILNFIKAVDDGRGLKETVLSIAENYPPQVLPCLMNSLGTHDTPRILTALVDDFDGSRAEKAARRLSMQQMILAKERLRMASFLQFTLPGSPCVYYGDEAGMEGYADPFNRRPYPWGAEDGDLLEHYRRLTALRRELPALRRGEIQFFQAKNRMVGFTRELEGRRIRIYINRSHDNWDIEPGRILLGHNLELAARDRIRLAPMGLCAVEDES